MPESVVVARWKQRPQPRQRPRREKSLQPGIGLTSEVLIATECIRKPEILTAWPATGFDLLWKQPIGGGDARSTAGEGRT